MLITTLACGIVGVLLPFSPVAGLLGFSALPISFFLILLAMTITYLTLVELAKIRFYAAVGHPKRPASTPHSRHRRHAARRAARYSLYTAAASPLPATTSSTAGE
jgi:Mg2+-importing ATPase